MDLRCHMHMCHRAEGVKEFLPNTLDKTQFGDFFFFFFFFSPLTLCLNSLAASFAVRRFDKGLNVS